MQINHRAIIKIPSKKLQPGNRMARLNKITLTKGHNYNLTGSYFLVLHLEGVDLGENFEGFLKDKNDLKKGRYKGQVGKVKSQQYAYQDRTTNDGMKISRDMFILSFLRSLAKELNKSEQLAELDADTIEDYVSIASDILQGDTFLEYCIAGREWIDNKGFTNYDLFLPRSEGGKRPFAAEEKEHKLIQFVEDKHIIRKNQ